jgi:hypothetical protein
MIRAYRIDVRTTGSILGHEEVGARVEVLVASAEHLDPEEFAERVGGAVRGAVSSIVELQARPSTVEFSIGGWAYRTLLAPGVADVRVRELALPPPQRVIRGGRDGVGSINRAVYTNVPRRTAEALADYLMDCVIRGDSRVIPKGETTQHVRDREDGLRRAAARIREAAGWQNEVVGAG